VTRPDRTVRPEPDLAASHTVVATLPRPEPAPAPPPRPAPARRIPAAPSALATTGELVAALWDSDETTPIDGWVVSDFVPDRKGSHTLRILLVVALVVAGVAGPAWWFLTSQDRANAAAMEAVTADVVAVTEAAAGVERAATDLADGALDVPLDATRSLSDLNGAARALFDDASVLGGDAARATRLRAVDAAQQALAVESGLGDAVAYEAAIQLLLERPDLPLAVDDETLPVVAADTAAWVSRFVDGAAGLPGHSLLEAHRADVATFADGLADWQAGYLDRLRSGDAAGAEAEASTLLAGLDGIETSWGTTAARVADWSRGEIATLRAALATLTPAG
jgi:hypothetical protein